MAEMTALAGLFGLSGAFALIALALAGWMAWRIVEKAGLPGWAGLGTILLTLTGIGSIVPVILLWVFAFMRWPRDEPAPALASPGTYPGATSANPAGPAGAPQALPPPPRRLADGRGWKLEGGGVSLFFDDRAATWTLTGPPAGGAAAGIPAAPNDLVVPDSSVGVPHARLLTAGTRIGLEDLGTPGGTWLDGARLLPEHGPRDITAVRSIRLGAVELALSRA